MAERPDKPQGYYLELYVPAEIWDAYLIQGESSRARIEDELATELGPPTVEEVDEAVVLERLLLVMEYDYARWRSERFLFQSLSQEEGPDNDPFFDDIPF